jgi:hypothetical protein
MFSSCREEPQGFLFDSLPRQLSHSFDIMLLDSTRIFSMLLLLFIALEPIFEEIDRGLHSGVSHSGLQEPICPGTPGESRMWYATKCLGAELEMPQQLLFHCRA